jgi:hypothetical protein
MNIFEYQVYEQLLEDCPEIGTETKSPPEFVVLKNGHQFRDAKELARYISDKMWDTFDKEIGDLDTCPQSNDWNNADTLE